MTTTVHPHVQTLQDVFRAFRATEPIQDRERFEAAFKVVVHDWLRWQVIGDILPPDVFKALQKEADLRIVDVIGPDVKGAA